MDYRGRPGRLLGLRASAPLRPHVDPSAVDAEPPSRAPARPQHRSFLRRLLAP